MKRFLKMLTGENKQVSGSAKKAKERLQILIAKDISESTLTSHLVSKLQAEILAVVRKYIDINEDDIDLEVAHEDGREILGLNITFPDEIKKKK